MSEPTTTPANETTDADILREIGMDEEAADLDNDLNGTF